MKEYEALVANKAEIQAFLAKYLTAETDIVLTGAGTSAFIGDAIAPVLRGAWKNVRIEDIPQVDGTAKILHNGQILIIRGNEVFNTLGQMVK